MKKNETKVVCPKCGTEFAIPERSCVAIGVVIGKDSGLGRVALKNADKTPADKAKKRLAALEKAGIDTSCLFAMQTGGIARNENGVISVVPKDDPIYSAILNDGTIPDRRLFRRWVMSQMFHLLTGHRGGFIENLRGKGDTYQWNVIGDELRTQMKLVVNDPDNFVERNRWFNKSVVLNMCNSYLKDLQKHVKSLSVKKCKGIPYVKVGGANVFAVDLEDKVFGPIRLAILDIEQARCPRELYIAYCKFNRASVRIRSLKMYSSFIDAYKGVGAYYTMKNLILFHGCVFIDEAAKRARRKYKMSQEESMAYLTAKAKEYSESSEGWRLFGVMKKLLETNHVDIEAKIASWRKR